MVTVKASVFGSEPERRLFNALASAWPESVHFYHNLPLLQVLNDDVLPALSSGEREFVLKTSVDIVACDLHDHPICCIEFDGIGDGYLSGGRYVAGRETSDRMRQTKLDLKARLFREADLDFTIVGHEESRALVGSDSVTIAHGIVGLWLARSAANARMMADHAENQAYIDSFPIGRRWEGEATVEALANIDAMEEWNPLVREATDAVAHIARLEPSFRMNELFPANAGAQHGLELAEVTIAGRCGTIVRRASMRGFGNGLYPYNLCMEAARLHAAKAYLSRLQAFSPEVEQTGGA